MPKSAGITVPTSAVRDPWMLLRQAEFDAWREKKPRLHEVYELLDQIRHEHERGQETQFAITQAFGANTIHSINVLTFALDIVDATLKTRAIQEMFKPILDGLDKERGTVPKKAASR